MSLTSERIRFTFIGGKGLPPGCLHAAPRGCSSFGGYRLIRELSVRPRDVGGGEDTQASELYHESTHVSMKGSHPDKL